jgi:hypothetical protein
MRFAAAIVLGISLGLATASFWFWQRILFLTVVSTVCFTAATAAAAHPLNKTVFRGALAGILICAFGLGASFIWHRNASLNDAVAVVLMGSLIGAAGAFLRRVLGGRGALALGLAAILFGLAYWLLFSRAGNCHRDSDCPADRRCLDWGGSVPWYRTTMTCEFPCGSEPAPCASGSFCAHPKHGESFAWCVRR